MPAWIAACCDATERARKPLRKYIAWPIDQASKGRANLTRLIRCSHELWLLLGSTRKSQESRRFID